MLTINEIKELIKEKMINEYCPYVIKSTKSKAATYYIYYKCAIKKCESYFRLKFVNNKLSETKSEWKHNHPMNRLFLEGNYLFISKDKKDEICGMRMNGASPGYIRKSLNLTISSDQLYNISRKTIQKRFEDEIDNLEIKSKKWNKNYYVIHHFKSNENEFHGLTLINRNIIKMPYASDICVIDDTLCINKYKYPIVAIYCYDENDKAQLLSVGIITGKTFNDFEIFLKDISDYIQPRVFICDRLEAQKNAIENIFKNSHIVLCKVHIRRNVIDHFGKNSKIYIALNEYFDGGIDTNNFLKILNSEINANISKRKHLLLLLDHIKYYNPSVLKHFRLRNHYTSNLVEGSFAAIKNWTNHDIIPLAEIIETFLLHSEMLMKKSISMKKLSIDSSLYSGKELGNLCILQLMKEYDSFKDYLKMISNNSQNSQIIKDYLGSQECSCNIRFEYELPCIHVFYQRYNELKIPLLRECDIPSIYFKTKIINVDETEIIHKKDESVNESKDENYKYSNLMDMISPIASEASRNKDVQKLFDHFFEDFNNLKVSQKGSPSFISQQGRPVTRQSLFVEHNHKCGAQKKKSRYHCKICGTQGHNSATCPHRDKNILNIP